MSCRPDWGMYRYGAEDGQRRHPEWLELLLSSGFGRQMMNQSRQKHLNKYAFLFRAHGRTASKLP